MKGLALGVAFLLEVFMVGAYSYAGFHLPAPIPWRFLLGIALPAVVIIFWAQYMAPKAEKHLKNPQYLLAKAIIFFVAAVLLGMIGWETIAIVFVVITIVDEAVLVLL